MRPVSVNLRMELSSSSRGSTLGWNLEARPGLRGSRGASAVHLTGAEGKTGAGGGAGGGGTDVAGIGSSFTWAAAANNKLLLTGIDRGRTVNRPLRSAPSGCVSIFITLIDSVTLPST